MTEKPLNEKEAKFTLEMLMGLAKARNYIDASDIQNLRQYIKYLFAVEKMFPGGKGPNRCHEVLPGKTVTGIVHVDDGGYVDAVSYRLKNLSKKIIYYVGLSIEEERG